MEKVLSIIFRAKHWQIFATFMLLGVVGLIVEEVSAIGGLIFDIVAYLIHFGWILLLGYGLSTIQRDPESIRFWVFLGTGLQLVVSTCLIKLLDPKVAKAIIENKTIFITLMVYSLVTLTIVYTYPAKTLKLLESKADIDINDYFGDIFLLLFWPFGIWNIQPRINKMADRINIG